MISAVSAVIILFAEWLPTKHGFDYLSSTVYLYQVQKCKNNIRSQLSITDRTIQLLTTGGRYFNSQEILPCT